MNETDAFEHIDDSIETLDLHILSEIYLDAFLLAVYVLKSNDIERIDGFFNHARDMYAQNYEHFNNKNIDALTAPHNLVEENFYWDIINLLSVTTASVSDILEYIEYKIESRQLIEWAIEKIVTEDSPKQKIDYIEKILSFKQEVNSSFCKTKKLLRKGNLLIQGVSDLNSTLKKSTKGVFFINIYWSYLWIEVNKRPFIFFDWTNVDEIHNLLKETKKEFPELSIENYYEFLQLGDFNDKIDKYSEWEFNFYLNCKSEADCEKKIEEWHSLTIILSFVSEEELTPIIK